VPPRAAAAPRAAGLGAALLTMGLGLGLGLAAADSGGVPTALVESISAPVAGVTAFDYLRQGSTVTLPANDVLTLDYISQCVRETITGGTVTIGADRSTVDGGSVKRSRSDCDGGDLQLAANQSQGAVVAYRNVTDEPTLTLDSTAPIILAGASGTLRIERLDRPEPPIVLDVRATGTPPHAAIDLAQAHRALGQGGVYRATIGQRKIVFRVAADAAGADAPVIQRVLPL
jgi:hypothetical protein